jgi:ADP-L-glycero-D-manno-heptose 6-epimerase
MQLEYNDKNIHSELQRTTQALKAARLMKGWSRKLAAEKLGYSMAAVEQFENNRSNLSPQRLQKILSAYGYSEEQFAQIRRDSVRHLAEVCEQGKKDRSLSRKPRRNEYKVVSKEVRALRILRKRRGISQCEASRLCGYIPRRFSHLEAGRIKLEHVLIPHGEKIDWMVHLGACTDTAEMRKDFLDEWNVEYTKSIWNWCAQHKVPLVYASSGATYGAGEHGFSDSWETAVKLKPLNPYGQSKQDFDLWAKEQVSKGNAPPQWYGLKFFNVYGPREGHKGPMASAVLHSYRHILRTGRCRLFKSHNPAVKDGEQSRDFIHVSDIVTLTEFVMKKKPASALYNCGTGKARTFYAMMEALFASLGKPMQVDWIDTPPQYRKAYQYFTEADMSRMNKAGYDEPFLSLERGVASYVEWLKANDVVVDPGKFQ